MLQIDPWPIGGPEPRVPGCVGDAGLQDLSQEATSVPLLLGALAGASLVGLAAWWFTRGGGAPAALRGLGMNDTERAQWIDNDEGLYDMQRRSRLSKREWIRQNRDLIDVAAGNVKAGVKRPGYLKYG